MTIGGRAGHRLLAVEPGAHFASACLPSSFLSLRASARDARVGRCLQTSSRRLEPGHPPGDRGTRRRRAIPEGRCSAKPQWPPARTDRVGSCGASCRASRPRHRVLREFKTIPYVALEVDYDTLRVLDSMPGLATRVDEDILLIDARRERTPHQGARSVGCGLGRSWPGHRDPGHRRGQDPPFLAGKVIQRPATPPVRSLGTPRVTAPMARRPRLDAAQPSRAPMHPAAAVTAPMSPGSLPVTGPAPASRSQGSPGAPASWQSKCSHGSPGASARPKGDDPCTLSWTFGPDRRPGTGLRVCVTVTISPPRI